MATINREEIRKEIYKRFGWTIAEWARRRGFSPQVVYFALAGDRKRAGGRRMKEILKKLEEDLSQSLHKTL